ncbi:MAG TPA: septum formation initiator family protein [Phycicoccus sp.]|nr:septum formation initiator family protein [Phycicoccus sp.]HQH08879.1 septum formation initiator family protein [Phycicoccus sp.]HQK33020.1 septum formation initiator family protein [Phycicoccus sp.]HQY96652.1 septum formation initiator family protein [Phycicoccus sp.]HRA44498.1 septum formation initiator family protein [Phycicoccus sp.]
MPSAPSQPALTSVAGWRSRLDRARSDRRTSRVFALVLVGIALMVLVGPTLKAYVNQRSDIAALRDAVAEQTKAVEELQAEQARWEDPAYIEQQARQRLKFVKPGEKSYTVLDPQTGGVEVPGMAKGAASADTSWYATVWSSVKAADAPAAAAP